MLPQLTIYRIVAGQAYRIVCVIIIEINELHSPAVRFKPSYFACLTVLNIAACFTNGLKKAVDNQLERSKPPATASEVVARRTAPAVVSLFIISFTE